MAPPDASDARPDPLQLWDETARSALALVHDLAPEDWERATALPGWSVRDVVAHLAHLESVAAQLPQPEATGAGTPAMATSPRGTITGATTEAGVQARREASTEEILAELDEACARRREVAARLDLSDPKAPAPAPFDTLGWDLGTLLHNRPIDLWVHEVDIRRAVGREILTDGPGATHLAGTLTMAFPFALRKLPVGTSVVAEISGPQGRTLAAAVGDDGRARPLDASALPTDGPTVRLVLDDLTWMLLGGGRSDPEAAEVGVTGDAEVAARVLAQLNVMP